MSVQTDRTFGLTIISCDSENCTREFTHESGDDQPDFTGAMAAARKEGWVLVKTDDDWKHYHSLACAGIKPTPIPCKRRHSTFYGEEAEVSCQ